MGSLRGELCAADGLKSGLSSIMDFRRGPCLGKVSLCCGPVFGTVIGGEIVRVVCRPFKGSTEVMVIAPCRLGRCGGH